MNKKELELTPLSNLVPNLQIGSIILWAGFALYRLEKIDEITNLAHVRRIGEFSCGPMHHHFPSNYTSNVSNHVHTIGLEKLILNHAYACPRHAEIIPQI